MPLASLRSWIPAFAGMTEGGRDVPGAPAALDSCIRRNDGGGRLDAPGAPVAVDSCFRRNDGGDEA